MPQPPQEISEARRNVDSYTTIVLMFVSSSLFLSIVPFIPAAPFLPVLISAGLAALWCRKPRLSSSIFGIIVFFAIFWQITGFGIYSLGRTNPLEMLLLYFMVFIPLFLSRLKNPVIVPLASMSAALMITPHYYLSVPMIGVAAFVSGLVGISTLAVCFILYLLPFLLIENALILSGSGHLPVVFAQLSQLQLQLRPSLSSLNIFASQFPPPGYLSERAGDVMKVLSSNTVFIIITPLIIFAIVFITSAEISGAVESLIKRLNIFEGIEKRLKWFAPLAVSIVMPIVFYLLISALAQPAIGDYQPPFATNSIELAIMIGLSLTMGAIFTARELFIQRLERPEFTKKKLFNLMEETSKKLDTNKQILIKVTAGAPTLDLNRETNMINSCKNTITDVTNHAYSADLQTLTTWLNNMEQLKTEQDNLPEMVRVKLASELSTLFALVSTFNATLQEVGATTTFREVPQGIHEYTIDAALEERQKIAKNVRETTSILYDKYITTTYAYSELTNLEQLPPPLNPSTLLDSNDIFMAMKLICEEYWLNFHTRRKEEMTTKATRTLTTLHELKPQINDNNKQLIQTLDELLHKARPIDAPEILNGLKQLRQIAQDTVKAAINENEKLNSMTTKITPIATKTMGFESIDQQRKLETLYQEVTNSKTTFEDSQKIIESILIAMGTYEQARKRDTERIIIISQYPTAKNYIKKTLQEKGRLPAAKMPFPKNVSLTYLRIYAESEKSTTYNDETEEITLDQMH